MIEDEKNENFEIENVDELINNINIAIKNINYQIENLNKDEKEAANDIIKQIIKIINTHIYKAKERKKVYTITKSLIIIINAFSNIYNIDLKTIIKELNNGIDNMNFTKSTLINLKKWLKQCQKNETYNKLLLSESILYSIIFMQKIIHEELSDILDNQYYALKGIKYIKADLKDYDINKLKYSIENGIQKLKN